MIGQTTFTGVKRLRLKESDRIVAMEEELQSLGVEIHSDEDTVWVNGPIKITPTRNLKAHNDHRVVMALAILATIASQPVTIVDAQVINKSYPDFFEGLNKLELKVDIHD